MWVVDGVVVNVVAMEWKLVLGLSVWGVRLLSGKT